MSFVIRLCCHPHPQAAIDLPLSLEVSLHFLDFRMKGIIQYVHLFCLASLPQNNYFLGGCSIMDAMPFWWIACYIIMERTLPNWNRFLVVKSPPSDINRDTLTLSWWLFAWYISFPSYNDSSNCIWNINRLLLASMQLFPPFNLAYLVTGQFILPKFYVTIGMVGFKLAMLILILIYTFWTVFPFFFPTFFEFSNFYASLLFVLLFC